jgi:hypothetical protein
MISIDSVSSLPLSSSKISSLKFILYLKNKEISEVINVLERVKGLSKVEQKLWKEDYGEIIDYALDLFVDDSNVVLDKLSLDEEVLDLSHKLVSSLQIAIKSAESILGSEKSLNS